MSGGSCTHLSAITTIKHPSRGECAECVKIGARWVHLRTCQECGQTLCCDSSPNQHAAKHARASGHPVIASAEPSEGWLDCYPDAALAEYEHLRFFFRDLVKPGHNMNLSITGLHRVTAMAITPHRNLDVCGGL